MTEQEMMEIIQRYEQAIANGEDLEQLAAEIGAPTKKALQSRIQRYRQKLGITTAQDKPQPKAKQVEQGITLTPEQLSTIDWLTSNIGAIQDVLQKMEGGTMLQTEGSVKRFEGEFVRYNNWLSVEVRDRFKKYCEARPELRSKDVFSSALDAWLESEGY